MAVRVEPGDCLDVMRRLATEGALFDAIVTDPPYHLTSITKRFAKTGGADRTMHTKHHQFRRLSSGFMGKEWDGGDVAFDPETWALAMAVLKPGGYLIAFGGSRTYDQLAGAIRAAGFIIHPLLGWIFGQGFPKAHSLSKALDRDNGVTPTVISEGDTVRRMRPGADQNADGTWEKLTGRTYTHTVTTPTTEEAKRWDGWSYGGQALKPALEPICMAQKPIDQPRMVDNVRTHGVGALNIDGCRIEHVTVDGGKAFNPQQRAGINGGNGGNIIRSETERRIVTPHNLGRWPANLAHDGSDAVIAAMPNAEGAVSNGRKGVAGVYEDGIGAAPQSQGFDDDGSVARFFYCAKATKTERDGSKHPTVKPVALMRWLVRLVTPPGGHVLDPFAGSGTTGVACLREGFDATLIEREPEYLVDLARRIGAPPELGEDDPSPAPPTARQLSLFEAGQ